MFEFVPTSQKKWAFFIKNVINSHLDFLISTLYNYIIVIKSTHCIEKGLPKQ